VWARRVSEWRASGKSSAEFCEGQEFSAGGLRHWAHRLEKIRAAKENAKTSPATSSVRVLRVVRRKARSEASAPRTDGKVVIELGRARVAVEAGFDRETLRAVVEVLAGSEVVR
jgi:transposase